MDNVFPLLKTLNTGDIASGSYKELTWTPDKDIVITKIMMVERNDYSLSDVQAYITIADVPATRDYVPASAIGSDPEYCYKPNAQVTAGSKIYVKIANSSSNTINVDVVFEYTTK